MFYHLSEIIVFVLFLPVFMNIIVPLGMLVGWLLWRSFKLLLGNQGLTTEKTNLATQSITTQERMGSNL